MRSTPRNARTTGDGSARNPMAAGGAAVVLLAVAVAGPLGLRTGDRPATEVAAPWSTPVQVQPKPSTDSPAPEPVGDTGADRERVGARTEVSESARAVLGVRVPARPAAGCNSTAKRPFVPTAVTVPDIGRRVTVVAMRRDAAGVPGVPPRTAKGKAAMAFDLGNGVRPGAARGNALLNAHTWPDGSAVGNRLLAGLHKGDQVVVHGARGRMCYRVTKRVEVSAGKPMDRYYAKQGRPQIAIVACSGKRLGPGMWTKRTVWFASPVT